MFIVFLSLHNFPVQLISGLSGLYPPLPHHPLLTCFPMQLSFIYGTDKQIQAKMQKNDSDFSLLISLLQEVI